MESNRGLKRSEPDTIHDSASHGEGNSSKRRKNYKLPQRASPSKQLTHQNQLGFSRTLQLTDITVPRNEYRYSPIDADSIRLLYLQPGVGDDNIHCRFETFNHSDAPIYEAISYTWGEGPAICPILVDNAIFYVRSNLHSALRHLRNANQEISLWVDALCINQDDNQERSRQVQKMGKIFQESARVLIWLGESDASSQYATDFISQIQDPQFLCNENWFDDFGLLALARLLNGPWFSRLWVIQEVALARDAIFVCGNREFHLTDLADSVEVVRSRLSDIRVSFRRSPYFEAYEGLLDNLENSRSIRLLDTLKDLFLRSNDGRIIRPRTSLESLIHSFNDFQSTDPRDRVYALLGLAHRPEPGEVKGLPTLTPDYDRTVLEVYTVLVMDCIRISGSLDILVRPWADGRRSSWQGDFIDPDLRFAVPSWISVRGDMPFSNPKFQRTNRVNADSLVGKPSQGIYNAHNGTIADVRFGIDDATKTYTGSLFAKGIILGEIKRLSTRMADGIVLKECLEMIEGILFDDDGTVRGISDPLWRIMCANRNAGGDRAPSLYRLSLLQLLRQSSSLNSIDTEDCLTLTQPRHVEEFLKRVQAVVWNRRIFRSQGPADLQGDLIGLAPQHTRLGDRVCILYGCSVPVILRAHRQSATNVLWELVGEAYVDGIMEGQAIGSFSENVLSSMKEEFEIR
ncbi:heterokaryon incompatibility protein-domain-containing protein [Hypoxylon rubiginosum]|uniref:Heterokaryon incompatibility protein-domain-containing protein n=1 Tax=Hypoxylon rubiginosum TaxID=110542 RepID=A0ACC0CQF9_9PEZI|nr:heterokaryon incompatibility protein-domain-containing protein [Hypoxylon rubiginosum]